MGPLNQASSSSARGWQLIYLFDCLFIVVGGELRVVGSELRVGGSELRVGPE